MSGAAYDFSAIPDEAVDEFLHQGQECLAGIIQLAIASDQRATTMAGIFGAGSVALLTAAAAILTGDHSSAALGWACLIPAFGLFFSSFICAWAARPIDFYVGGYEPRHMIGTARNPVWMKRYVAEDIQKRIDANGKSLRSAGKYVTVGAMLALASPAIGFLVFLLSFHLS